MRNRLHSSVHGLVPRLGRGAWLAALALVLALHPATGAGESSSRGLAGLLRELLCGCAECAGEVERLAQAEPSCCGRVAKEAASVPSSCDEGGACSCSHPDEVPVPDPGPLLSPSIDGEGSDLLARLDGDRSDSERTPCVASASGVPPTWALAPPADMATAARGASRHATRPAGVTSTGTRLARLSTLRL
jgi:hypothetical protein